MNRIHYSIRFATPDDISLLPAIEREAAKLLRGHAPPAILEETTSLADFEAARSGNMLWVATCGDAPIGFALVRLFPSGQPHLQELDVRPDHGRQGIGREFALAVVNWARSREYSSLTLTTFRNLPWNMPFYAKLGFEELLPGQLTDELQTIVHDESARGLDSSCRVVMRYRIRAL